MATATENLIPTETALDRGPCDCCRRTGILIAGLCLDCDRARRDARAIDDAEHTAAVLDGRLATAHQRIGALEAELRQTANELTKVRGELAAVKAKTDRRLDAIDAVKHGGIRQLLMIANNAGDVVDSSNGEIFQILGKFPVGTRSYSELPQLIETLAGTADDYEAANEINEWLGAWE